MRCASTSVGKMLPVPHCFLSVVAFPVRAATLFGSDHQRLYSLAPAEAAGPPLALDLNDPQAASNSQDRRTPKVHMCTLALLTCSSVSV